ncbi:DNA-binding transcriptional LysR family regulator [Variovorax boronicumulans]|jgi:DNA-binding transcriptional LysR family regulator|uniref:DNA-binding transcriptional LysR family regulator n=1 Tax=Variovorax boronicumulans TaxID=436515 RepID=A0AAW8CYE5_9BURK|nr:LysR substrate-binding domain-containing protein [Variovorax boronicumulans]MDP9894231.1 DNA-binding transcriptional LysR family regulator [Variovorax boronicumulans]MDP9990178.1 DNA-binding transcriptional LysR family regulator [Variovorax boronicumulans]MDQ0001314.1 DNA-binding transcriptional LysR family regulator [Variovorax boronicumulans]MDQ0054050.1 DNA-binding transcriptional LysR family regulator [Variovorax boronicumulans]
MNLLASMRYLVALSEHKHFGRAAQACHITQPALSNALRALETEFGVVIVKRARVYVGLTHEGERVLATAQRMLRDNEVLLQELRSDVDNPHGRLRMAAVPTAIPILSRFAAMLHQRHPGILPAVLSMSSQDLETGLESLSIDLALGYTERMHMPGIKLKAWPQSIEHYFLLRRAETPSEDELRIGQPITWAEAGKLPLCLLTTDMHNRAIMDQSLREAGVPVSPAIETNSVLTLTLAVSAGTVSSVLPGAMVAAVRTHRELEALPLVAPEVRTPIGFMTQDGVRASRALDAALAFLQTPEWAEQVRLHSGTLGGD